MQIDWPTFWGAMIGGVIGVVVSVGAFILIDEISRRTERQKIATEAMRKQNKQPLDNLLENHLQDYIVENWSSLFPGWRIFESDESISSESNQRPRGVKYRTPAGEIDILAMDEKGDFVVMELKRRKAPDRVVAQVDRYMSFVERQLVQAHGRVRAVIIAQFLDNRLQHILLRRPDIEFRAYQWELILKLQEQQEENLISEQTFDISQ